MVDLANLYDKPIAPETWEIVRREAVQLPEPCPARGLPPFPFAVDHPPAGAVFARPARRRFAGTIHTRFCPGQGLLQFNLYHKYTVDEHCLRQWSLPRNSGPILDRWGASYRSLRQKYILHLALLLHDLGKGFWRIIWRLA